MRNAFIAALAAVLAAPSVAVASGPIHDACKASPEASGGTVDCDCAQTQADKHLSPADQTIAAAFISKSADPAAMIGRMGQAEALRFVDEFAKWGEAARAECGAPPPQG